MTWKEMSEEEWLTSTAGLTMELSGKAGKSRRKSFLVTAACIRRSEPFPRRPPPRITAEDVERLADGLPSVLDPVADRVSNGMCNGDPGFVCVNVVPMRLGDDGRTLLPPTEEDEAFTYWGTCSDAWLASVLRDIVGNPFRQSLCVCRGQLAVATTLTVEQASARNRGNLWLVGESKAVYDTEPPRPWLSWNGGTVRHLAQAAYEERSLPSGELDTARLAVLADALEEAGCADAAILSHLRGPGPHVRGCWAVDLLLGKE
jgi:hypothetical protein